ncbi:DUF6492 family protein [Azospirillum argentinense]
MSVAAFLPIKIRTIPGEYRKFEQDIIRVKTLFFSLSLFAKTKGIDFYVCCPKQDIFFIERELGIKSGKAWGLPKEFNVQVIDEESVCPFLADYPHVHGGTKQQVIKLSAPEYFGCDRMITFDSDVICVKPIDIDQVFGGEDCLLDVQPVSSAQSWWQASAKMLQYDVPFEDGIGVTPTVLDRAICQNLFQRLEEIYKFSWYDVLLSTDRKDIPWTEYTLYYLTGFHSGLIHKSYRTSKVNSNERIINLKRCLWGKVGMNNWTLPDEIKNEPGYFVVAQSQTGIDAGAVHQTAVEYYYSNYPKVFNDIPFIEQRKLSVNKNKVLELFMTDLLPHIEKALSNWPQKRIVQVLDVGASTGAGSSLLARSYNDFTGTQIRLQVTALDIEQQYHDYATHHYKDIEYIVCDVRSLVGDRRWDIVTASHIVEYVPDPEEFIDALKKLTRGKLIVSCLYNENNLREGRINKIDDSFIMRTQPIEVTFQLNSAWPQRGKCVTLTYGSTP